MNELSDPLTWEQISVLPTGTEVEILWSGGNGPHRYLIDAREAPHTIYWRSEWMNDTTWERSLPWQDSLHAGSFIGDAPPRTVVRLVLGKEQP